jgi:regulator of sigma E protease
MILFIIGILLFIGLVVVHEMGHFWAARRNGVDIEEFGIFFPPRLWKRRTKKGWDFTINLLPLGGFVRLKGETDSDKRPGSFGAASDWSKAKIMLAGVAVNLVVAVVLFTLLALIGMPKLVDNQFTVASDTKITNRQVLISYVEPGSPADEAGLKNQDKIVGIGLPKTASATNCSGSVCSVERVYTQSDVKRIEEELLAKSPILEIQITRDGKAKTVEVEPNSLAAVAQSEKDGKPIGYLGIVPTEYSLQRSTWSAPIVAVGLSGQLAGLTFQGLGHALAGLGGIIAGTATGNTDARQTAQTEASEQVSGPVGIFVILQSGSLLGFQFMLMIIAVISLTLAIMNVLPIPALDGGRLFVMAISRVSRKPLTPKVEEGIYATGFILLITLIILITIVDVKRFF